MLLDRAVKVETDPFPHVIIENALPQDYYDQLSAERPSQHDIIHGRDAGHNERFDLRTKTAISTLKPIWKSFCSYHSSMEFYDKVVRLFDGHIQTFAGKPSLRCQPAINTPSPSLTKVRGPHLDNPTELYAGLFYLASDDDGGDLEIYSWKDERSFYGKLEVYEECVELRKTVPYKPNTYVMFINSDIALHGVTPRKSKYPRYLVNVTAEVAEPLFRVGYGRY